MMHLDFAARCMIYVAASDEDHVTEVFSTKYLFDHSHGDVTNDFRRDLENELLVEVEKQPELRGWQSAWIQGHYVFSSHETMDGMDYDEECHIDAVRFAPADKIDMEVLGQPYEPPQCFVPIPPKVSFMERLIKKDFAELRVADAQKLVWELYDEPTQKQVEDIAREANVPVVSVVVLVNVRRRYEYKRQVAHEKLSYLEWLATQSERREYLRPSLWEKFCDLFR